MIVRALVSATPFVVSSSLKSALFAALLALTASGCDFKNDGVPPTSDGQADSRRQPDGGSLPTDRGPNHDRNVADDNGAPPADSSVVADARVVGDLCSQPSSCDVTFTLAKGSEQSAEIRGSFDSWGAGAAMTLVGNQWEVSLNVADGTRVLYKFVLDGSNWIADPANPNKTQDGFNNSIRDVVCPMLCRDAGPTPDTGTRPVDAGTLDSSQSDSGTITGPFDWRDAIMYFVMIDRFENGNSSNDGKMKVDPALDFHGGDLKGLLAKINAGYFDKLGINALWISSPVDVPDTPSPGDGNRPSTGYHGYWPDDMFKVEKRLGDLALLKQVVSAAHARGIRVVMDYVMNHVHETSPVYRNTSNYSKQYGGGGQGDWFWDLHLGDGTECSCRAEPPQPGWGFCHWDDKSVNRRCWFTGYLPDFNFSNAGARAFSVANAIKWVTDTGVDGLRLDAVKHIETSWLTDLRSELKKKFPNKTFYLVGETFTGDRNELKATINPQTMLDGQFDFGLRAQLVKVILMRQGNFWELDNFLKQNDGFYGPGAIMGNFLGNHDVPRSVHMAEDQPQFTEWALGKDRAWNNRPSMPSGQNLDRTMARLKVGYAALFALKGMPLVYYGDEIAMPGAGDPDNRRPMTWSGVSSQQQDLKAWIGKLAKVRSANPALRRGNRTTLHVDDDTYAYEMKDGGNSVIVVLNRSDWEKSFSLNRGTMKDLLSDNSVDTNNLKLSARTALILQ
jgi:glycosidase